MKKGLILTDYWNSTWIWNYAIDLYDALKDDLNIDFLNIYSKKWFSNYPKKWEILDIWNFYINFFFWFWTRKILKYIQKNKYDYVLIPHQWMGYIIPYLKKIWVKIFIVSHDFMSYNIYKNNLLHIIFRNFSINNIVYSDKMIFTSFNTLKDFEDLWFIYNWEKKIIHEYVNYKNFYRLENKSNEFLDEKYIKILTSVTSWQPHKNDITFFKIALNFPNYLFIKVWKISEECEKFIKENNIKNIKLLNKLAFTKLVDLYNNTDIYINTSIKEGFWYPPHEALFCWAKLVTANSIDLQRQNWIFVVNDFYDVNKYIEWINIVLNEEIDISNLKHEFSKEKFAKEFILFLN